MKACPDANTIQELLQGTLDRPDRESLEAHVDTCGDCRAVLVELARTSLVEAPTEPSDRAAAAQGGEEPVAGERIGRFVVERRLGSGGMGVVYAAQDPTLHRTVAIKLLRGVPGAEAQVRFLREAQSLAKLSHPNVVAVHELGTHGDRVFIAMEHVEGRTLGGWLSERRRDRAEIVRALISAGRGLAAAHAAGLVHRDFKPDNVLIDRAGVVKVTDFGLARSIEGSGHEEDDHHVSARERERERERSPLPATRGPLPITPATPPLTESGALLGTPAYMAPEQRRGERVTAASDVYSFSLTLLESLVGKRPDPDPARAAAASAALPTWLRRPIQRALSPRPDERPSMTALLADLARDPAARRRWIAVGAVAAAAVAAAIAIPVATRSASPANVCGGAARHLDGVWDPARREAVRAAFLATGRPYAASTFGIVDRVLAGYVDDWVATRTSACEATRRGEQSPQLLDLRMHCLDGRREDLRALVDRFVAADGDTVERASEAARLLPPIDACSDTKSLTGAAPLPTDPKVRHTIDTLTSRLAAARALRLAGRYAPARDALRAFAADAGVTGWRPLEADVLSELARAESAAGDLAAAEATLERAALAAEAGRVDRVAARIAIRRVDLVAVKLGRLDDADAVIERARAAIERLGGDPELEADLLDSEGDVMTVRARFQDALDRHTRAVEAYRKIAPDHPSIDSVLDGVASDLFSLGRYDEAVKAFEDLRDRTIRESGPDHPDTASILNNLGAAYLGANRPADSVAAFRRAIGIMEKTIGPDHAELAKPLVNLAFTEVRLEKYADGVAHAEQALAILERAKAPPIEIARVQMILAMATTNAGDLAGGAERWRLAIDATEKAFGPDHPMLIVVLNGRADALNRLGRPAEALPVAVRALALAEKMLPADNPDLARVFRTHADVQWDLGRRDLARAGHERALAIQERSVGLDHTDAAETLRSLARLDRQEKKYSDALPRIERAYATFRRVYGDDHWTTTLAGSECADMLLVTGRHADALAIYERILPVTEKHQGKDSPKLPYVLTPMAQSLEKLDRRDEALPHLERALSLSSTLPPTDLAEVRFSLARVLPDAARSRAVALAEQARAAYHAAGKDFATELADVDRWLKTHR